MKLTDFIFIVATFIGVGEFCRVEAGPTSTTYSNGILRLEFGDDDDTFQMGKSGGFLTFSDDQEDPNFHLGTTYPLLTNDDEPIPDDGLLVYIVDLGGGNDVLGEGQFVVTDQFALVMGGPGDDTLWTTHGLRVAYFFGGEGNDTYNGAEGRNDYVFGGPGNDVIFGSNFGVAHLDGGAGTNYVYGRCCNVTTTTFVHNPGANDNWLDDGDDGRYVLLPGSGSGTLNVTETGGTDSFYKGGHTFDVDGSGDITSDIVSGNFSGWANIEQVSGGLPLLLQGDFNVDGAVDVADYVWWRAVSGDAPLYDVWRANFGASNPEPPSATLAMLCFVLLLLQRIR